jgi:signal transduction histidine kinase
MEARWHDLVFSLELSAPLPNILADRTLIEQVVMNLVHNAIEAMLDSPQRKLIIRTSSAADDNLKVEIIDTGTGISNASLGQLFDPFFTTKSDGMGMGLAITRSIVEAHEGCLSAKQNESQGATFCFTIPIENKA